MLYERSLSEVKAYVQNLKESFGYENIQEVELEFPISDYDLVNLHLNLPEKNLLNGLEICLDREDYETAELIQAILDFRRNPYVSRVVLKSRLVYNLTMEI